MKRRHHWLNIICLGFGIGFVGVTLWYWRRAQPPAPDSELADVPLLPIQQATAASVAPTPVKAEAGEQVNNPKVLLPKKLNLSVPFTSQAPEKKWVQPWEDACEEAAVLMLDAYYKGYNLSPLFAKDEMLKMVKWQDAKGWGYSITLERVKELLTWYSGKRIGNQAHSHVRIVENPTVDDIKQFIAKRVPVYVVAYGKALPNPHFRDGGPNYHALIIRGYTEDKFITNDPGTQFGQNFTYKYDVLMNAIHDWNGGDVKHGPKAVLVIE